MTNRTQSHPVKDAINLYKHDIDSSHDAPTPLVVDSKPIPTLNEASTYLKAWHRGLNDYLKAPRFEDFMN